MKAHKVIKLPTFPTFNPHPTREGHFTHWMKKSHLSRCRWRRRMGTQSTNALWCHSSMLSCLAWIIWGGSGAWCPWIGGVNCTSTKSVSLAEGHRHSLFVADFVVGVSKRKNIAIASDHKLPLPDFVQGKKLLMFCASASTLIELSGLDPSKCATSQGVRTWGPE